VKRARVSDFGISLRLEEVTIDGTKLTPRDKETDPFRAKRSFPK
jgi:hypothetical protein